MNNLTARTVFVSSRSSSKFEIEKHKLKFQKPRSGVWSFCWRQPYPISSPVFLSHFLSHFLSAFLSDFLSDFLSVFRKTGEGFRKTSKYKIFSFTGFLHRFCDFWLFEPSGTETPSPFFLSEKRCGTETPSPVFLSEKRCGTETPSPFFFTGSHCHLC